jgi:hypothetical protein
MRRIMLLVTVALVMAAMLALGAGPAFGAADGHASCQGAAHSNQTEQGAAGDFHGGHSGVSKGENAKSSATFGPQGQDRNISGSLSPSLGFCTLVP